MRLEQLTFTRFLAAVSIVVFHYGKNIFPFNSNVLSFIFKSANTGVSYFFVLSGFVIMIAYGSKDKVGFWYFIKKRLARIYPVYALSLLILLAYFIVSQIKIPYQQLLLHIGLLQSWIPGNALSLNYPGWSLSVEMFFYLSFPFLFTHFYKKISFKNISIAIIIFFCLSQLLFHLLYYPTFYASNSSASHDALLYFPLMHLNEFLVGNFAGLFFLKGNIKRANYDLPILLLALATAALLKFNPGINYHNGMLAPVFVPFILLLSASNGILSKIFNLRPFVFLGEISYGIYILQFPVFIWGLKVLGYVGIDNPALTFWINIAILIVLSAISYTYFETPLRKAINKRNQDKVQQSQNET